MPTYHRGSRQLDIDSVVDAIQSVLPKEAGPLALHEPAFLGREWEYVKECLDTGWVSSVGRFVDQFEAQLAKIIGVNHAIACVNGTAALHAALKLVGVRPDEEVLVPAMTFVATANAVSHCGAIPHFIDIEESTLGIDPDKLARVLGDSITVTQGVCRNRSTGRRIAAMVPVHVFGHPVDLDPLMDLSRRYSIPLVEDATESLGSTYKGRPAGSIGHLAVLSFNGNKIITTGGGGAIVTNDPSVAKAAKHLTTTAKVPHKWAFVHDEVAFNYRMPNINAALGCAQLEQLDGFVSKKRALAERYSAALEHVSGISFLREPGFARSNYWLNALILSPEITDPEGDRARLLAATHAANIGTRPSWELMHRLKMYEHCPRADLSVAEDLGRRVINLPSSVRL